MDEDPEYVEAGSHYQLAKAHVNSVYHRLQKKLDLLIQYNSIIKDYEQWRFWGGFWTIPNS